MEPRRLGELGRIVGEIRAAEPRAEQVADLDPVLVDRRHEQVRRPLVGELDDQLRQVGLDRPDARRLESLVEPDLVGRERLHLHDLVGALGPDERGDDLVRLGRVARPVDDAARRLDRRLQLDEHLVEPGERRILDRRCSLAQRLPVGHLGHDGGALGADRAGRVADVGPDLGVRERRRRRVREALGPGVSRCAAAHRRRGSPPGAPAAPRCRGGEGRRRCASGTSCRRHTPRRRRSRRPPPASRRASPPRRPRSSPRTCRRSRSTPPRPAARRARRPARRAAGAAARRRRGAVAANGRSGGTRRSPRSSTRPRRRRARR